MNWREAAAKHEKTCAPCAVLERWRAHNERCTKCVPATGKECWRARRLREAWVLARAITCEQVPV